MIDIDYIRTRCDELLEKAVAQGDQMRIQRLQICKEAFADDDPFPLDDGQYGKLRRNRFLVCLNLELSADEESEFTAHLNKLIEDRTKVRGILYPRDRNGREYPVEAILDPRNESYCQLGDGSVCKKRFMGGGYYDTYVLFDGRWVYDGSLQRQFEDPGYDYESVRYVITEKK